MGKWTNKALVFDRLDYEPFHLEELQLIQDDKKRIDKLVTDVQSGMDEKLDKGLLNILNVISLERQPVFYTDCFKMVSRNIEKLFKVMEYVLRKDCIFLTCNFYLSNGYVAKRKNLIPPAHTNQDFENNLRQFNDLRHTHLKLFKQVSRTMLK